MSEISGTSDIDRLPRSARAAPGLADPRWRERAKAGLRAVMRLLWRVEVHGAEHIAAAGPRALIVPNHVSFLDPVLIAVFLPGAPVFAIDTGRARQWWIRPFLRVVEALPIDPARPMAAKSLVRVLREDRHCVIFPEGRLNSTGGRLMKVYVGPAVIADRAEAVILPVRIDGTEATPFSHLGGTRYRRRWFPKIVLTVLPPTRIDPGPASGRERRERLGLALYDIMADMMARRPIANSLFAAMLASRQAYDFGRPIVDDIERPGLTYRRLVLASLVLGRKLEPLLPRGAPVGVMLPNAAGVAVTFMALQAIGRVPAMLNYTAGSEGMAAACRAASVGTVLTSRRFIELAKLHAVADRLGAAVRLVYLEDVRVGIRFADKLRGMFDSLRPGSFHAGYGVQPDQPAVILFTSGSEGAPKGVVLSHRNLQSDIRQIGAVIDFSTKDKVLNALPVFHSFGLTGGFLLPLLSGVPSFLYPSPLHYKVVPEVAYDFGAPGIAGKERVRAEPYDFNALRLVLAGAERLSPETRAAWAEKFQKVILEGYGVTECAPVVALNTPMYTRFGTVGRLLPLVEHRLEAVEGIERGGRLVVRGPNVMLGYYRVERPGVLEPPPGGWHDTGDIVEIDGRGFIAIQGRAKRFAKLGGEMVSLAVAERIAAEAYPDAAHAVVAIPDPRKGERLVLLTEAKNVERRSLSDAAARLGLPPLAVAAEIVGTDKIPLLGTGKIDYPAVTTLVAARIANTP